MMIKKIKVKNFRSFKDLKLNIGKVNILIGANASGKSNFVEIFRFLRDIVKEGLENAISLHGETQYIRNANVDISENLLIEIREIPYIVNIEFTENGYKSIKVIYKNQIIEYKPNANKPGQTIRLDTDEKSEFSNERFIKDSIDFRKICICDFDPKFSKMAVPIFARADLEEDGKNLVTIIKKILDDPEKKRIFMNLVSYLLPYIKDIDVDKRRETDYYLTFKEKYFDKSYLPAFLTSDGTINVLGLVVALYFQESPLIIIEEPDKGLHPSLISRIIDVIKDVAEYRKKQIIITTHNPIMIKYADPEDVFLVFRNREGFSQIYKPIDKEEIKVFLENDMTLADLYESNLLEI